MKITLCGLAVSAILASASAAYAQSATLGTMPSPLNYQPMTQQDACPVVKGGVGGVPTGFVPCGYGAAMLKEQVVVPITGFTITPADTTTLLFLNPATTPLATGTVNLPAHPADGESFCLLDSGVVTALTVAAAGTTIVGTAVTATVAGTTYCWRYVATTTSWYRYL